MKYLGISTLALSAILLASGANASAIIDNGTIMVGVDDFGQLNVDGGLPSASTGTTVVGLRYLPSGQLEATSNGCLCEGWGVGIATAGGAEVASGSANNDRGGANGLSLVSFASTATTATSVVSMGTSLEITHAFSPSAVSTLYSVKVSITNTSGAVIDDLRYTRTFDWDVDPTTFNEFVTIGGSAAATAVLSATDNGFVDSNPFAARPLLIGGSGDFTDIGPSDIGSNFDFGFGPLGIDETFSFEIFYGAAATEVAALTALNLVGAEVYSLGQASCDPDGNGLGCESTGFTPATFIFGFKGVGGVVVPPVPVPGAALLLLTGLGGLGALGARRRRKTQA